MSKAALVIVLAGCATTPTPSAEHRPEAPEKTLTREQVRVGMDPALPTAKLCYQQHRVPGVAMVKLTVAPSGNVTAATVTGRFSGTPSGACIEGAVKQLTFAPAEQGMTFDYPLPLR